MMTQIILSITALSIIFFQISSAMPLIAEPPKEISTNQAGSFAQPNIQKKNSFVVPLTAEVATYRRGPMTRKAIYDPVRNITHIWDMRRGSYNLPGDHTIPRTKWSRRRDQQED